METQSKIQVVGHYTISQAGPEDCSACGMADYGDVLIEGVCSRCLREMLLRTLSGLEESNKSLAGIEAKLALILSKIPPKKEAIEIA